MPGSNQAVVSPDERMLAIVRSYSNKPRNLSRANQAGAPGKQSPLANRCILQLQMD
jgi:hypothetical protein